MKKRIFSQIVSIIITLTMLLQICPLGVLASVIFSAAEEKDILPSDALNELDSDPVLEEDVSKRNEFSKHYVTPDGRRYAVIYSDQIHYEEDGEWKEIDNTFTLSEGVYQSNNETFKTRFAEKANDNSLVSIEEGEYKLSWSLSFDKGLSLQSGNIKSSELTISSVDANVRVTEGKNEVKTLSNISNEGKSVSALSYNNIFTENVDVNYSVYHGKVKEDVILKSADAIKSYTMIVNAEGLYAVKNDDNTVSFVNREGDCIFTLGAPWMMDAKGDVSDEISVMLFSKDGKTLVTYTPSEEWLNSDEREYPVVIDPSFTSRNYTSNYEDTYVHQNDGPSAARATETMLLIGNRYGEDYYAYIKIKKLIDIDEAYYVNSASFNFRMNTTAAPALSVYSADEEWDADTITYATQPQTTLISSANNGSVVNSYSKYSIDLTSWMSEKARDYGRISDFFDSSEWNGFKIGYTTIMSSYHEPIYSSEYTTASYRPTMVIEYAYEPYGGIKDGAVYSFKNVGSGKYMTASSSASNVYQYTKNNTNTQAFRLEYDSATEGFRIKTVTDNNGIGNTKCISFVYNSLIGSGESAALNVQLTSYSASRPENQDWIIATHGNNGYYKIVSAYDPNYALTSNGNSNGSSSGSSVDAAGNVYITAFNGSENQLWEIESGGSNVNAILDIKEEAANNESYMLYESGDWISYYCTVDNFGDTVTWSSSNPQVATVNSDGVVVKHGPGVTTISATVNYADGETTVYSISIKGEIDCSKVYQIKNYDSPYRYLTADPNITNVNCGFLSEESYQLWKFERQEEGENVYYKIIPLCNPNYKLKYNNNATLTLKELTNDDVWWKIELNSQGWYTIRPKSSINSFLVYNDNGTVLCQTQTLYTHRWEILKFDNDDDTYYTNRYNENVDMSNMRYTVFFNENLFSEYQICEAVECWNGISSNINLVYVPYSLATSLGIQPEITIIFLSADDIASMENPPESRPTGVTKYVLNDTELSVSEFTSAAFVDRSNIYILYDNIDDNYKDDILSSTITHEVGHALMLKHMQPYTYNNVLNRYVLTNPESPKATYPSIMQPFVSLAGEGGNIIVNGNTIVEAKLGVSSNYVTYLDKSALRAKWGD